MRKLVLGLGIALGIALALELSLDLPLAAAFTPLAAEGKNARCIVRQNGAVAYSGSCRFLSEKGGSFSIRRHDARSILPSITDISVDIISTGRAEVRGLTIHGNNSRWGAAVRSKTDAACWTGSDFEICAY